MMPYEFGGKQHLACQLGPSLLRSSVSETVPPSHYWWAVGHAPWLWTGAELGPLPTEVTWSWGTASDVTCFSKVTVTAWHKGLCQHKLSLLQEFSFPSPPRHPWKTSSPAEQPLLTSSWAGTKHSTGRTAVPWGPPINTKQNNCSRRRMGGLTLHQYKAIYIFFSSCYQWSSYHWLFLFTLSSLSISSSSCYFSLMHPYS